MLLLHALLFSLLTSNVVSEPDTPYLFIQGLSQYSDEWYRVTEPINGQYNDDVMDVHERFIDFGRLNTHPGKKALMPGDQASTVPHAYLDQASRERVFGTWRPMPKASVHLGRLDELVISQAGNTISTRIIRVQVVTPIPDIPISSYFARKLHAGPSPDIEGTFYRISTKVTSFYHDVTVFKRGCAPKLYSLSDGDIVYIDDHIQNERLVGCWCRWPDPSLGFARRHDLLIFWMDGTKLKHKIPTVRRVDRGASTHVEQEMPPSYQGSGERSSSPPPPPPPSYDSHNFY